MFIKKDYDFNDLMNSCWDGAVDTLNRIYLKDKEDELIDLLEETFYGKIPTLADVNDFLCFEDAYIYESLNIW